MLSLLNQTRFLAAELTVLRIVDCMQEAVRGVPNVPAWPHPGVKEDT